MNYNNKELTNVPNLLLVALAMAKLSGLHKGVILYLLTKINNPPPHIINLSEWANALDSEKSRMSNTLKDLCVANIIHRTLINNQVGYSYDINFNVETWDSKFINKSLLMGNNQRCSRCGSIQQIESHHIIQRIDGGSNKSENKEQLCAACHDYEHAKRNIIQSLNKAKQNNQSQQTMVYENRLNKLEELNTPELIKIRGYYRSWWEYDELHYLPRKVNKQVTSEQVILSLEST